MMAQVLYTLAASILLGFLLVLVGLRGKRLNTHPVCCWCGFDLQGVYPDSATCPECGAGLKRARAVRRGVRRKRWLMAACGALLALLPLVLFVLMGAAAVSGANLSTYKPARMLLIEGEHASAGLSKSAIKELLRRLEEGTLSEEQTARAVAMALEMQADRAHPWCVEWGDVIEMARAYGRVSNDDYQRYLDQAPVLECRTRSQCAADDPLPVLLRLKESRVGTSSQFMLIIGFGEVTIAGTPISKPRWEGNFGDYYAPPGREDADKSVAFLYLTGAAALQRTGPSAQDSCRMVLTLPAATTAGELQTQLTLRSQVLEMQNFYAAGTWPPKLKDEKAKKSTHQLTTLVLPKENQPVRLLPEDPETTRAIAAALVPQSAFYAADGIRYAPRNSRSAFLLTFCITPLKVPIAFDVFLRDGTKEVPLGELTSGEMGPVQTMDDMYWNRYVLRGDGRRSVRKSLPDWTYTGKVDLVLRPSTTLARKTLDQCEIYGGVVVLKDVPIEKIAEK